MLYKTGDKVRIVKSYSGPNWNKRMNKHLGTVMTIRRIDGDNYKMREDIHEFSNNSLPGWDWKSKMIEGLVEEFNSSVLHLACSKFVQIKG